jgi:hypothetical protein
MGFRVGQRVICVVEAWQWCDLGFRPALRGVATPEPRGTYRIAAVEARGAADYLALDGLEAAWLAIGFRAVVEAELSALARIAADPAAELPAEAAARSAEG